MRYMIGLSYKIGRRNAMNNFNQEQVPVFISDNLKHCHEELMSTIKFAIKYPANEKRLTLLIKKECDRFMLYFNLSF